MRDMYVSERKQELLSALGHICLCACICSLLYSIPKHSRNDNMPLANSTDTAM